MCCILEWALNGAPFQVLKSLEPHHTSSPQLTALTLFLRVASPPSIWVVTKDDPGCSVLLASFGQGTKVLQRDHLVSRYAGTDAARLGSPRSLLANDAAAAEVGTLSQVTCAILCMWQDETRLTQGARIEPQRLSGLAPAGPPSNPLPPGHVMFPLVQTSHCELPAVKFPHEIPRLLSCQRSCGRALGG